MKKLMLILALVAATVVNAQNFYLSPSVSVFNGTGTFSEKAMPTLEIGRTFEDVFSAGVAVGRTSFHESGKYYVEFRPTLTVFSKGAFSASGTLGAGYIFDSPQNFLTEYCGTMSVKLSKLTSLSIFAGGYKFEGKDVSNKYTFVGTGLTFTL